MPNAIDVAAIFVLITHRWRLCYGKVKKHFNTNDSHLQQVYIFLVAPASVLGTSDPDAILKRFGKLKMDGADDAVDEGALSSSPTFGIPFWAALFFVLLLAFRSCYAS